MVERSVIGEMLDEFRFDDVVSLIEQASDDPDPELLREIARRRAYAENRAKELVSRVIELGETDRFGEIIELAKEAATRPLLALTPASSRKRAELYVREAERWSLRRGEINARRLEDARRALEGLDLELARGLMRRIDDRFLSDGQEEERDRLLLDLAARTMEMESITETGRRLADEIEPQQSRRRRRRWRRRSS
jgi:hypothetical protein